MGTAKPIAEIDLRRDLPKVREYMAAGALGGFYYSSPCAIGAMLTDEERERLKAERLDGKRFHYLHQTSEISAPPEQAEDIQDLQTALDSGNSERFAAALERLEAKYLAA